MRRVMLILGITFLTLIAHERNVFFGKIDLQSDNMPSKLSTLTSLYADSIVSQQTYQQLTNMMMSFPASRGYLFPSISIIQVSPFYRNDSLFLNPTLQMDFGPLATVDTLIYENLEKTSPKLLNKDLSNLTDRPFSPSLNAVITEKLKKYSFLQLQSEPTLVTTKKNKFGLRLLLQEIETNAFKGIIGYVPKTANKKGYFTGQVDIDLKNIGGMGRGFRIFWSKVNENSQELQLKYFEPHLLGSNYFTNLGFTQTLRDTLVVIRNLNFGLGRNILQRSLLEITGNYETTLPTPAGKRILNLTTNKIIKTGLHFQYDSRDIRTNPSKGFFLDSRLFLGFHEQAGQTNRLTEIFLSGELNLTLPQSLVLNFNSNFQGKYLNNSDLTYSDLYWFGGVNSLRGYPEDFFAGREIGSAGVELRWITGYYSRIYTFIDQGYYQSLERKSFFPYSFGVGLRLESRMGTIGLDYAFGEDDSFTTAKIHLQLENRF